MDYTSSKKRQSKSLIDRESHIVDQGLLTREERERMGFFWGLDYDQDSLHLHKLEPILTETQYFECPEAIDSAEKAPIGFGGFERNSDWTKRILNKKGFRRVPGFRTSPKKVDRMTGSTESASRGHRSKKRLERLSPKKQRFDLFESSTDSNANKRMEDFLDQRFKAITMIDPNSQHLRKRQSRRKHREREHLRFNQRKTDLNQTRNLAMRSSCRAKGEGKWSKNPYL